jgi:hypothetical protein
MTPLNSAIVSAFDALQGFANQENFWDLFETAFGQGYDRSRAAELRAQWQAGDFSHLPPVIITDELGAASGGYAASTDTIYLSQSLLDSGDPAQIVAVLLEEIGHSVDARINTTDAPGDEGAIFSALVRGESLSAAALATLRAEDDSAIVSINGEMLTLEQAVIVGAIEQIISTNADGASSVFAADVDGDEDMDILSASYLDDTIALYRNNGSGSFTEQIITTNADGALSVFAADVAYGHELLCTSQRHKGLD